MRTEAARRDLDRLAVALASIEGSARALPWASERAWTTRSHLWFDLDLVTLDLHDLSVSLACRATQEAAAIGGELETGALCLVTGRGRHSIGASPLRAATQDTLAEICSGRSWVWYPHGPGRLVVIFDPTRAPDLVAGRLPWPIRLGLLAVVIALAWLCAHPQG